MTCRTSIPRVRRVHLKDGASVRVLHNDTPREVLGRLRRDVDLIEGYRAGETAVGYALVVWGRTGATSSVSRAWQGLPVPRTMIPDFVRTCLADDLTHSGVMDELMPPPDGAS